jgi:hypothetical protein
MSDHNNNNTNPLHSAWITNLVNGQHGPDCLQTSRTFKVTTGSHTNAVGEIEYAEPLHDNSIYPLEHQDGCFGLEVVATGPFQQNKHIRIEVKREDSSQTDALTKVSLFKGDELVEDAWTGEETLQKSFIIKEQLSVPNVDTSSDYYYMNSTTSNKVEGKTCTFKSQSFKMEN